MAASDRRQRPHEDEAAYLGADRFMNTMIEAEVLATAFEIGLVDCLISRGPASPEELAERLSATPRGMKLLLDVLGESGVVEHRGGICRLASNFVEALRFRELMELKLALANLSARDLLNGFTDLVMRPQKFMAGSRFCRLFAYDRCLEDNLDDRRATASWMRITTMLTRYEAAVLMRQFDFSVFRSILDVGGNSGELALRLCRQQQHLRVTVFDLPLVCELGREHVGPEPEAERISFVKGNALADDFPVGHDLIVFKSMLHDWPDEKAAILVEKAVQSVKSGGEVLIFERAPMDAARQRLAHAMLPFLMFFHGYRPLEMYVKIMEKSGLSGIRTETIELEMPFMLVSGRR